VVKLFDHGVVTCLMSKGLSKIGGQTVFPPGFGQSVRTKIGGQTVWPPFFGEVFQKFGGQTVWPLFGLCRCVSVRWPNNLTTSKQIDWLLV